jgi:LPS export ABC transporter permease LptG/LPS export ABC transporter permease LptF
MCYRVQRMVRTLDRYILRLVLPPFVLALLVFTFMLQMQPLQNVAEPFIARGVPWGVILRVFIALLPQALAITIPMAFLLGLLIAFGRLSADSEWVALQACGVSLLRLLRPVGLLAFMTWAATSWMIIVALPWGNQTFIEIRYNILASWAESEVKPRVFFEDYPNLVLYVRDVHPGVAGWSDVFVAKTDTGPQPEIYLARHGRMVVDRARRTVTMVLEDGTQHIATADAAKKEEYRVNKFGTLVVGLDPSAVFPSGGPVRGENELTIAELHARIAEMRRQGQSPHNYIIALQQKYSIPMACLVFAVIGLAVGVSSARGGKLASFVVGIAVIFVYYVILYGGRAMAKGGVIDAWLAPWLPNIVLGVAGLALLAWRTRSAQGPLEITLPFFTRGVPSDAAEPRGTGASTSMRRRVVLVLRLPHVSLPQPRILDLYVFRIYVRLYVLIFVGLLGLFYISTFIDLSDKLFKGRASLGMLLWYFWFSTPRFVWYVIPLATLIAGLVTIGALTKNSELVVMKACGVSLYRVAVPLVVFGVVASLALFALEERVLAYANKRADALEHVIRGGSPQTFDVLNRRWVVGREGSIYQYVYFDPRRQELNGLSVYEFDTMNWRLARRIYAGQASYVTASGSWRAVQGWIREFQSEMEPRTWLTFTERPLKLEPPDYFGTEQPDAERMSYTELRDYVNQLRSGGFDTVKLAVDLHRKLSFPFVTLVMTLIAVPFAVTTGRHGALYGIGVGIILAMLYWITGNVFGAIGAAGKIAPVLAAWAPNLLFGAGAAYLLLTVKT